MPLLDFRKLVLSFLLVISVLGIHAQCGTPINSFPYVEDFETAPSWTTSGPATSGGTIINDWAWGSPTKPVISSAGSGVKCWVVGGLTNSSYANGDRGYVLSPCFNFTSIVHPYIQFLIFWESEHKYDGSNLQYSLNGGTSWSDVGAASDASNCMNANWFNYSTITNLTSYTSAGTTYQALATSKNGWCGNIQATSGSCQGGSGSGGWVTAKHCMPYLAGQPSVRFRFTFGAGTTCNAFDGIAFDSVAIGEGTPNTGDFTYTCVNTNTLHFVGTAPLCPDTFQWNFGDPGSGASNTVLGAGTLTPTHTFSAPGQYSVTLTIKGGPCNPSGSVTKILNIINATVTNTSVSCNGGSDGTATAIVTGNANPYSYAWSSSPAQSHDTATGLTAGTYTVTVTTSAACSATASTSISQPTALAHTIASTPSLCTANNGTAKATESGGTMPYTYLWSNSLGTTDSIKNVGAGTYTLTVTDSKGCTDIIPVTVSNGGGINATISNTVNVGCHGDTSGSLTVNVSGGTTPYTYHWGTTTTTVNTQTGFAAGSYVITVTDANGCQATVNGTITQPTALAHTISTTPAQCGSSTGKAQVIETGGTPTYSYIWSNALGTADSIQNQASGSYTLTVTDSKGCRDTVLVSISNIGGVTTTLGSITNVTCSGSNNGSITVNASNGTTPYTYHWGSVTNANSTQGGFIAGNYIITVSDNAGCISTVSASVSQPPSLSHTMSSVAATCGTNNGSVQVIESGGTANYSYTWSGGLGSADSIKNVGAGTYTLTITDAVGCTDIATTTLTSTPAPSASLGLITPVSCFGLSDGSITINVSSGTTPYTYHWGSTTNNNSTQGGFSAGSYSIVITDASSCSVTVPATISQPAALTAVPTSTDVLCPGGSTGSISLTVSGGNGSNIYHWTNTSQTTQNITGLTANSYNVTVMDSKGCQKDTFATISQPTAFVVTFPTVINDSCSYGHKASATVSVSGGSPNYSYLWSNAGNTPTISNLAAATYTVTITDASSCTVSASVPISAPAAIIITSTTSPLSCYNDSNAMASISVTGGTPSYVYAWSDDSTSNSISHLNSGTYIVTVTDSWGCTASSSVSIVNPLPLAAIAATTGQSCASQLDGSLSLTPSGGTPGYTYQWSPVSGSGSAITGLTAGTYFYTVTDAHSCVVSDSAIVSLSSAISLSANVIQPLCPPLATGNIVITASGGNPGYTYTWSNAAQTAVNSQLAPGTYTLTVTDSHGCMKMETFLLSYQGGLSVSAGVIDSINLGQSVTLTAVPTGGAGNINYFWSPDYHLSCVSCQSTAASPVQSFTYIVSATDANGCKATDSVRVLVNVAYDLYIPNAFTPNGDGKNDYFEIFGNKSTWKVVEASIFNRWGEKVFESNDLDFSWDGRFKGELQNPGVFVYLINVTFINGHSTGTLKGSLSLIR